jgi:hypothetical protein
MTSGRRGGRHGIAGENKRGCERENSLLRAKTKKKKKKSRRRDSTVIVCS